MELGFWQTRQEDLTGLLAQLKATGWASGGVMYWRGHIIVLCRPLLDCKVCEGAMIEDLSSAGMQDAISMLRAVKSPCLGAFEGLASQLEEHSCRAQENVAALEALGMPCRRIAEASLEVSYHINAELKIYRLSTLDYPESGMVSQLPCTRSCSAATICMERRRAMPLRQPARRLLAPAGSA